MAAWRESGHDIEARVEIQSRASSARSRGADVEVDVPYRRLNVLISDYLRKVARRRTVLFSERPVAVETSFVLLMRWTARPDVVRVRGRVASCAWAPRRLAFRLTIVLEAVDTSQRRTMERLMTEELGPRLARALLDEAGSAPGGDHPGSPATPAPLPTPWPESLRTMSRRIAPPSAVRPRPQPRPTREGPRPSSPGDGRECPGVATVIPTRDTRPRPPARIVRRHHVR